MGAYDYDSLKEHVGHAIECVQYADGANIAVECTDCNEVLFDYNHPDMEREFEDEETAVQVGIVLQGGLVQSVFASQKTDVIVIDYDKDDYEEQELTEIEPDSFGRLVEHSADIMPEEFIRLAPAVEEAKTKY